VSQDVKRVIETITDLCSSRRRKTSFLSSQPVIGVDSAAHMSWQKPLLAIGKEHLTYLGVFVMAGYFYIAQAIFVGLMIFPTMTSSNNKDDKNNEDSSRR
jgi:hypothetical protein